MQEVSELYITRYTITIKLKVFVWLIALIFGTISKILFVLVYLLSEIIIFITPFFHIYTSLVSHKRVTVNDTRCGFDSHSSKLNI